MASRATRNERLSPRVHYPPRPLPLRLHYSRRSHRHILYFFGSARDYRPISKHSGWSHVGLQELK
jgi:hypothetical protein